MRGAIGIVRRPSARTQRRELLTVGQRLLCLRTAFIAVNRYSLTFRSSVTWSVSHRVGRGCRASPLELSLTDPDLNLSIHPARAIARSMPASTERGAPPGRPVGPNQRRWPAPSLQPHYRTFVTTTRQSAPLRCIGTFGLAVVAACAFSLGITGTGTHVPYQSLIEARAAYTPDAARSVSGHRPSSSRR